jgi:hypothetical protein
LHARYYDPANAQFIECDPAQGSTRQPYSYAGGSPLNASDPTGLDLNLFGGFNALVGGASDLGRTALARAAQGAAGVVGAAHDAVTPDYVSLSLTVVLPLPLPIGGTGGVTYTRAGELYGGGGFGGGSPGFGLELRGGKILGPHTDCEVNSFVQGKSVTASGLAPLWAGLGPSVGGTWGNPGHYTSSDVSGEAGVGFGTLGGAAMVTDYEPLWHGPLNW